MTKRFVSLNEFVNFRISKNKMAEKAPLSFNYIEDFIYNKETKVSNLAGVLYVIIVTIISAAGVYLITLL